jgi:YidC/Oxa1 family membrane protein insertase
VVGEAASGTSSVETNDVRAVFTNRGGRLRHWVLKHYKNDAGEPLDLVPDAESVNQALLPFSLRLDDPNQTSQVNGALFRSSVGTLDADQRGSHAELRVGGRRGLHVTKAFTLEPNGFVLGVTVAARSGAQALNPVIEWGPGLGDDIAHADQGSFLSPSYSTPAQALFHQDSSVTRLPQTTPGTEEGPFLYAGIDDHYFAALVLNDKTQPEPMRLEHTSFVVPPRDAEGCRRAATWRSRALRQPRQARQFFIGPKAFDQLRAIDSEMVRVINFGIFSWLAVPLLGALKWVTSMSATGAGRSSR